MMPASSLPRLAAVPGLSLPRSLQPTPTDEARRESFPFAGVDVDDRNMPH